MPILLHDIVEIYEEMRKRINIDYVSVIIFVSTEADSLCSMKILSVSFLVYVEKLLQSENMQYKFYPVGTYTELEQKIEESREYEQVKLWMFINCGGCIDLTEKWFIQDNQHTEEESAKKVILFDVNKPINHKNIECKHVIFFNNKEIFIVDDEYSGFDKRITSEDIEKLEQFQEMDIDEAIQDDEDDEEVDNSQSPKRSAKIQLQQRLKKHKELIELRYQAYYEATFYSLPTSYLLYKMIHELNKANNHTLWYAIVGMTSMYLDGQISREVLEKLTNRYRTDMVKFNSMNSDKKEKGEIFTKKGYQFPLMNHWSLYESMMNSPYLMTRLGLWNDKGVTKLHEILTKIGVPLEQAKQQYKYMLKENKESLENHLFTIAEDYDLVDIMYESFMRQIDTNFAFMASDYHYLITTLLEKPIHKSTLEELSEHRLHTFLDAYSLLEGGSQETNQRFLEAFKETNALVMKELRDIIERDNIIKMKNELTVTIIRCDTKEKRLFEHQNILIRLAYMIMEINRQKKITFETNAFNAAQEKKDKKDRITKLFNHIKPIPSIVIFIDNEKGLSLVVGVVAEHKNYLGNKFNYVVEQMKIHSSHDKFLSNVIVIPKDDVIEFAKKIAIKNL